MASKKQNPRGKAFPKTEFDPWLKWCAPTEDPDVQRFLTNPEERLGMGIIDFLDCIETLYPSEILSSAQRTISDATRGINLPKLENIKVAHVLDVEDEDGTILNGIPFFENGITKRLTLFELIVNVFSKLEKLKAAWPHQDAVERVKSTAKEFVRFLFAVYKMGQDKITQAKAQGNIEAAATLEKAYKEFCMIELTGDKEKDAERLFLEKNISLEDFKKAMCVAFNLDRKATEEINNWGEGKPLSSQAEAKQSDMRFQKLTQKLGPDKSKVDAKEHMAWLVCYVWCTVPTHKSKKKATDYVFVEAKEGMRLFCECTRARGLLKAYGYNPSTIRTEAAKIHAKLISWRKKSKMEWPDNDRELLRKLGKKSKAEEERQIKASRGGKEG